MRRIILFELNEVPFRVIDYFCRIRPDSTLARLMPSLHPYETRSEDVSSLSPWKTWPTVHRGVIDERHLLHDFGQDLTEVDKAYPPIWKILAKNGVTSGIFGSLHSYPVPDSLENYTFYFPDTFAAGSECFPDSLSEFQAFNLEMARESARNVTRRIPWKSAMKVIGRSSALGLKLSTYGDVGKHVVSELTRSWKATRRRTYQVVLAFDVFMKQLEHARPAFATFFSNHVASSMHRYWAACFPDDYDRFDFTNEWVATYENEINFTMSKFDGMLRVIAEFIDRNPEYALWVASSMGQEATIARPVETELHMTAPAKFMMQFGLRTTDWERRPSMVPDYNFIINGAKAESFRDKLKSIVIDGSGVDWACSGGDFFRIRLGHDNLYGGPQFVLLDTRKISFEAMGLENVRIDDKSNSNAYHIPTGSLLIYDPRSRRSRNRVSRPQISTLEIAPTILRNYGVPAPGYMATPTRLTPAE